MADHVTCHHSCLPLNITECGALRSCAWTNTTVLMEGFCSVSSEEKTSGGAWIGELASLCYVARTSALRLSALLVSDAVVFPCRYTPINRGERDH